MYFIKERLEKLFVIKEYEALAEAKEMLIFLFKDIGKIDDTTRLQEYQLTESIGITEIKYLFGISNWFVSVSVSILISIVN